MAALVLVLHGGLRADSIELANGQRRDGVQITSAKWDGVQYVIGKAPTTLSGEQVLYLSRDSSFLQSGRDALESGNYAKAVTDLNAVGEKAKDWEQAEARYLTGRAQYLAGNLKEAERVLKAYLDKYKAEKDWFVPFATALLGEILLAAKQPGTAEIHFKDLAQYGGKWAMEAKLGQGTAILASKGDPLAARRLFDDVARSQDAPLSLRQRAMVARGRAFLLQNQPQQAIKELGAEFFDAPRQGELGYNRERAEATLIMGIAHAALGGKENLEEAEIWFLRAVALYKKAPEIYSQACTNLAGVYTQLGNKTRADEWKARGASPRQAAESAGAPAQALSPAKASAPASGEPPAKATAGANGGTPSKSGKSKSGTKGAK